MLRGGVPHPSGYPWMRILGLPRAGAVGHGHVAGAGRCAAVRGGGRGRVCDPPSRRTAGGDTGRGDADPRARDRGDVRGGTGGAGPTRRAARQRQRGVGSARAVRRDRRARGGGAAQLPVRARRAVRARGEPPPHRRVPAPGGHRGGGALAHVGRPAAAGGWPRGGGRTGRIAAAVPDADDRRRRVAVGRHGHAGVACGTTQRGRTTGCSP